MPFLTEITNPLTTEEKVPVYHLKIPDSSPQHYLEMKSCEPSTGTEFKDNCEYFRGLLQLTQPLLLAISSNYP